VKDEPASKAKSVAEVPDRRFPQIRCFQEIPMRSLICLLALSAALLALGSALSGCSPSEEGKMESGKMDGAMDKGKMDGAMDKGKMDGAMDKGKMDGAMDTGKMEPGKMEPGKMDGPMDKGKMDGTPK
jgi:hypothetical protein